MIGIYKTKLFLLKKLLKFREQKSEELLGMKSKLLVQDEMLMHLLVRLSRLIFVVLVSESSTLAPYPVHRMSVSTLVQILRTLLRDFSLSFKLSSSRPTD